MYVAHMSHCQPEAEQGWLRLVKHGSAGCWHGSASGVTVQLALALLDKAAEPPLLSPQTA